MSSTQVLPNNQAITTDDNGVKYCVVCNSGSHRTDWVNKFKAGSSDYVACDFHTKEEINKAITAAESKKAADAKAEADAKAAAAAAKNPAPPATAPATPPAK